MSETTRTMNPLGWLILLIGFAAMTAFVLVYLLKMDISFLSFMFDPAPAGEAVVGAIVGDKAEIVPKPLVCFIVGGAGILFFLVGMLSRSRKN